MADIPEDVQKAIRPHLAAIARMFRSPFITLVVRSPEVGNVKGDLVLSNDNPTLVLNALRARMVAEAEIYAESPEKMTVQVKEAIVVRPSNHFRRSQAGSAGGGD